MSIAIDAVLHRAHGGGVEKAIEGMVGGVVDAGLPFDADVFLPDSLLKGIAPPSAASRVRLHRVSHGSRPERILKEQWLVFSRRGVRLWHFLGYVAPFFLPKAAVVVSAYDIIALTHPELCTRLNAAFYAEMLPRTIRRADRIVVPSDFVRRQIADRFPGTEGKIRVVPLPLPGEIALARPPVGEVLSTGGELPTVSVEEQAGGPHHKVGTGESLQHKMGPRDPLAGKRHLLFVGDMGPKKNVGFLLYAYSLLPADVRAAYPLRLSGRTDGYEGAYRAIARLLGIESQVAFTGYVPDGQLAAAYREAALLLYPSLDEGYGYPPLEAMAMGTPAVVSDRGALPEVAGQAGATVARLDAEVFAGQILGLLSDRERYRAAQTRGLAGVLRTTWTDYAAEMGRIYAELL
jgi:glycosyltransferase involved in cell wall biosynthesis